MKQSHHKRTSRNFDHLGLALSQGGGGQAPRRDGGPRCRQNRGPSAPAGRRGGGRRSGRAAAGIGGPLRSGGRRSGAAWSLTWRSGAAREHMGKQFGGKSRSG